VRREGGREEGREGGRKGREKITEAYFLFGSAVTSRALALFPLIKYQIKK